MTIKSIVCVERCVDAERTQSLMARHSTSGVGSDIQQSKYEDHLEEESKKGGYWQAVRRVSPEH